MNKKNKGFTTIELITSFTLASVIMIILFNIILILKDNLSEVNAKTNMLVEKDNLSYNINKRFKEKEISSITMCEEGDKCYEFTYSDNTSDKLIYSNTDKNITFNNYTFDIIDGITVEEPVITEHYDTMSSTKYNGYFIINIPIKIDNKDYSIKINKHFNTSSVMVDIGNYWDNSGNKYTMVSFLESTGTQYIDTKFKPNQDTRAVLEIAANLYEKQNGNVFGTRTASKTDYYGLSFVTEYYGADKGYRLLYNKSYTAKSFEGNIDFLTKRKIDLNKNKLYIDNDYMKEIAYQNFSCQYDAFIFAQNVYGTASICSNAKIYSCVIYDNDTLARDYIPVIDSSERPCLFDKVSRECYYNQGTGEFLWG